MGLKIWLEEKIKHHMTFKSGLLVMKNVSGIATNGCSEDRCVWGPVRLNSDLHNGLVCMFERIAH